MTAVLAVIVATGVVIGSGFGDAYAAILPAAGSERLGVYNLGQLLFTVTALAFGGSAAVGVVVALAEVRGSLGVAVLVALGVITWSAFNLQNMTLVALGRARTVPAANLVAGLGKIVFLLALAASWRWHSVETSFVAGALLTVTVYRPVIRRVIRLGIGLSSESSIRAGQGRREFGQLVSKTIAHSALTYGIFGITPFLVTFFSEPSQGALFALCQSVVQPLNSIAVALSASLIVHASSDPAKSVQMARGVMIRGVGIVTAGSVCMILVLPLALPLLNRQYQPQSVLGVAVVLCVSSILWVPFGVWSSFLKARRQMKVPLTINVCAAGLVLGAMALFASRFGAIGGSIAVLIPQLFLTIGAAAHYFFVIRRVS
ncbi:Uncharacterised protein [Mycobacteroides abscessus subsp. abscessus]|nr:Uncharacterised protein [Mycobacteroides abscessus subsp. abscessus]